MALEEIEFINGETPASAEIMNAFQQNIKNEFEYIAPVVLYENETGSTANITLSENTEDFSYIEIFYRDANTLHNAYDSIKVDNPSREIY